MAEVQKRLEALTVEIEELTRVGFFSDEERTSLVKKQFEFENKINSMNKSVQDYKEYISYLICLYRIIKLRRNKVRIADKRHYLEYRVLQRVKNLHEKAVARFPQEVDLFFTFFQFCKETNFQHASQNICQTMLKHHKNNEQVWLTAAQMTFHEKKDPEYAIKLLQQGIGILNTSSALYTECIQYEIINGSNQTTTEDDAQLLTLNKKVEIYLTQAKKHIADYKFYTNLLSFLKQYEFTLRIQTDIIKYLMEAHKDCEHAWDYLGQRELGGTHFDIDKNEISRVPIERAFFNCVSTYEKGLGVICEGKRQHLWDFYLDRILELQNITKIDKIHNYTQIVIFAFEKASNVDSLSERFYFKWVDLVEDGKKRQLLKYATEKMPLSIDLWSLRMRIEVAYNVLEEVIHVFEHGSKQLGENSLPLWQAMHDYNIKEAKICEMNEFYLLALRQHSKITMCFKPKYIDWLARTDENIDKCRKVYNNLVKEKPYCKEMYEVMYKIEVDNLRSNSNTKDTNVLESVLKIGCEQFGITFVDVWINYIKFFVDFKSVREANSKILKLVIEAKETLHEDFVDNFAVEYDAIVEERHRKKMRLG